MNKWEVDEQKQWSEKVRSQRFCPPLPNKNSNYEGIGSNKRKSFVKLEGMNGSNFKNETLFVSFTAIITIRNGRNKSRKRHELLLVYWSTLKIANDLPICASYHVICYLTLT